jgi:hypothetical protein
MLSNEKKHEPVEDVYQVKSNTIGDVEDLRPGDPNHDAVFGKINEDGPNYKDVCA